MIFFLNIIYQDINRSCYSTDGKTLNRVTDQYSYLKISAACEIIKGRFQDSLISFTFEDNPQLTTIGTFSFAYCPNLTTVNLSTCNKLKIIGKTAFEFCKSVTEVILPEGLLEIQFQAFLGVEKLVNITIPASVEKIGENAFYQSYNLRYVKFAEGSKLTSLVQGVFSLDDLIYTFQIPENVAYVHGYALSSLYINDLTIHPKNKYLTLGPDNSVLSANRSILFFVGKKYLSSFEVPEPVTTIITFCFFRAYFRTIKLPNTLTTIEYMCFYDSYLESIIIPESVKRIDDDAFRDCRRMTSVKFLGPVDFFDGYIFYQCDILDLISFPDTPMIVNAPLFISTTAPKARLSFTCKTFFSSTAIERDTKVLISYINESNLIITPQLFIMKSNQTEIYEYWGLNTNIMIPKNITTIKESAFENSTISQIGFEADSQLSTIEKYAFRKCSNLSSFDFSPTLLRFLGIESFKDCIKLRSANFASNQLVVMRNAFENCNNLVNVSNIADVLENCFSGCIKLADVKIRDNAAKIAYKSFEKCYSLESIKIPSSIEIISEHAFANCVSLKSIIFSETNNLLKISFNSFSGCNSLENISNFDSDKYKCFDNTLYYKNETGIDLIFHAFNSSDKVLILNCNVICSYSFTDCNNVYNISISPNSVSLIEKFSFYSCKNLKYINFPLSVETVESNSFTDCPSLRCPLIIENITIDYLRMIVDSGIPSRLLFSCHILAGSYNIQIIKRIVSNSPSLFWKHLSK